MAHQICHSSFLHLCRLIVRSEYNLRVIYNLVYIYNLLYQRHIYSVFLYIHQINDYNRLYLYNVSMYITCQLYLKRCHPPKIENEAFRLSQGRKLRKGAPGEMGGTHLSSGSSFLRLRLDFLYTYFHWDVPIPKSYTK